MKLAALLILLANFGADAGKVMPKVPKVSNPGADGFPRLPGVDSVLDNFSQAVLSVSSQTSSLEGELKKVQENSRWRMQNEKATFDKRLKDQELENQKIQTENAVLAKKIMKLHNSNDAMRVKIQKMEKVNKFRTSELRLLGKQLDRAHKDVDDAIAATDNSKAPELIAVDAQLHERSSSEESVQDPDAAGPQGYNANSADAPMLGMEGAGSQQDDSSDNELAEDVPRPDEKRRKKAVSLLETDEVEVEANFSEPEQPDQQDQQEKPAVLRESESLVASLSQSLKRMEEQEGKSEERIRALFTEAYKAGEKRHEALVQQSLALKTSFDNAKSLEANLTAAHDRLAATQDTLQQRIAHFGTFLGKLEQVAQSPVDKVQSALRDAEAWRTQPSAETDGGPISN